MSMPFRVQPTPACPVPVPLYPGTGRPKPSSEDQQIVQGKNERILCLGFFKHGDLRQWVPREAKISRRAIDSIQKCTPRDEVRSDLYHGDSCYLLDCKGTLWLVAYQATGAALWAEDDPQSMSDAIGKLVAKSNGGAPA